MDITLSAHRVVMVSAETVEGSEELGGAGVTLKLTQKPRGVHDTPTHDSELEIFLTDDQDALDAFLLAAAINCSIIGTDDLEDRRRRAAMALGWVYVDDAMDGPGVPVVPGHWERPWREGDVLSDNPMVVSTAYDALKYDLEFLE